MAVTLYLGNRRYSSWSLRGWLAVRLAGIAAEERIVLLGAESTPELKALTPSGLVPALDVDGVMIWDSLAICEYCAEHAPSLWPADRSKRAVARSIAAEMHAGFRALRTAMPMVTGMHAPATTIAENVTADIARITGIWGNCLHRHGGPFLFGADITVPDIMFAPVTLRFETYAPLLSGSAQLYGEAIRALPLMQEWRRLADAEPHAWRLAKYE